MGLATPGFKLTLRKIQTHIVDKKWIKYKRVHTSTPAESWDMVEYLCSSHSVFANVHMHTVHKQEALLWHEFGVTHSHVEMVWHKMQICTQACIFRNKHRVVLLLVCFCLSSRLPFPCVFSFLSPVLHSLRLCQMLQCGCRRKDFSQILVSCTHARTRAHTKQCVDACTQLLFYEGRKPISALTTFWKEWEREWKREKKEGWGSDEGRSELEWGGGIRRRRG